MKVSVKNISLVWEVPLALLSFGFYKIMKLMIGNLFTVYLAINRDKANQWRILSQEVIDSPLSLPVLMTKGPRWNTHAVIGTLGPFKVNNSLTLDLESANNSAGSWIAVVYSFPSYKTVTSIESDQVKSENKWYTINLPTGKYSLGVRYYNRRDRLIYPGVKLDDRDFVAPQPVASNINDFYHNLIQAKNWFYLSLHYYIFTILKLRNWLPESFVRREFLPVGAPDTYFAYNYLQRGQALQIDIDPEILTHYDVYFTLYDRSSLPLTWSAIGSATYSLPSVASNGYFLLRIRPKPEQAKTELKIAAQLITETESLQKWEIISKPIMI